MRLFVFALAICASSTSAFAQSAPKNPPFTYGMVPTNGQWINWFEQKQDYLGYTPFSINGGHLQGELWIYPSSTSQSGLNIGLGAQPSSPLDGDVWMTSAGLFYQTSGIVYGPVIALNPNVNYFSALSSPLPLLHEGTGGTLTFSGQMTVNADYMQLLAGDASLYTSVIVTGTPTTGQSPGITATLNGTAYTITTPATTGQTNQQVALAICNALIANTTLMTALSNFHGADIFGYSPVETGCANQVANGNFRLDWPYGPSNSIAAISTANSTVSVVGAYLGTGTPKMDGGPIFQLRRDYTFGYVAAIGDQGPYINFQLGNFGVGVAAGGITQTGYIQELVSSNTQNSVAMHFGTIVNGTTADRMIIGNGIYTPGTQCPSDQGADNITACAFQSVLFQLNAVNGAFVAGKGPGGSIFINSSAQMQMNNLANGFYFLDHTGTNAVYNITDAGVFTMTSTFILKSYTIGTLPASCTAGSKAFVTNGVASPGFWQVPSTTGSTADEVFCIGSSWVYG